jgi:hypothetical protein
MLMIEHRDIGWWYWLVTAMLLTYGLVIDPVGLLLAIGLNVIQLVHFILRERRLDAFPVQIRYWYLALITVLFPEPLRQLIWIPALGTWAQVIFGYCTMARLVSLLPWNRSEPLSLVFLKKTFLTPPVRGSIQQHLATAEEGIDR